jgi:hydroxymethylbilane synthase
MPEKPIIIGTRGSALALAQANMVAAECRATFPRLTFELQIIKTTGDKLQTASMAKGELPKGLFTKELEVALVKQRVDLCVHSLKDLPTELPPGLKLGAVCKRVDVRDVLVYRDAEYLKQAKADASSAEWTSGQNERRGFGPKIQAKDLPKGAIVATSSTRRKAQLLAIRPNLKVIEIRGNVATRLLKLAERAEMDATILAFAGLTRLNFEIKPDGHLVGDAVPDGLFASLMDVDSMLPCVGQAAIGIEIREQDERIEAVCARLNHYNSFQCVTAERAFLAGMGGGCLAPVAAFAEPVGGQIHMRAVSFMNGCKRTEAKRSIKEASELGADIAEQLK